MQTSHYSSSPLSYDFCYQFVFENIFAFQSHSSAPGRVGLEVEMLPVSVPESGKTIPASVDFTSLSACLKQLAAQGEGPTRQPWLCFEEASQHTQQTLLTKIQISKDSLGEETLTFEPGGQLEFSSKPYPCLSDAYRRLLEIQALLSRSLETCHMRLQHVGINPWHSVQDIGIQMPKPRYLAMNKYFSHISEYGQRMMRQTCSIQVCLDFGFDEATLGKRYLASQLLSPFAAAIFANSPYVDRRLSGFKSFRSHIWKKLDPSRTGLLSLETLVQAWQQQRIGRTECARAYVDFALAAQVVYIEGLAYEVPSQPLSFKQWMQEGYKGVFPKSQDFTTHLSLLFPEVRPRGFIELRSVDGLPKAFQAVPAAFFTGLLYDDKNLNQVCEQLSVLHDQLGTIADQSSMGLDAPVIKKQAQSLMMLALEGFQRLPECYRSPDVLSVFKFFCDRFTMRSRTCADDLIDLVQSRKRTNTLFPEYDDFAQLQETWARTTTRKAV